MHTKQSLKNVINLTAIKEQLRAKKRLEMIMRDSMDNIEEYGFQMYFQSNMDMLVEFEILPCYQASPENHTLARA